MKDKYIHEVNKMLPLPSRAKKEICRDLEEIFESAAEHGESEAQVIQRLGSPEEFVRSLNEQIDFKKFSLEHQRKKHLLVIICIFIASMVCFGIYAVLNLIGITRQLEHSLGIIGGADGPTAIFITPSSGVDFPFLLLLLGGGCLAVSVILLIRYVIKNHGKKD